VGPMGFVIKVSIALGATPFGPIGPSREGAENKEEKLHFRRGMMP